jgi:putative membrane protein
MRQFALLLLTVGFALGLAGPSVAATKPNTNDRTFVITAGRAGAAEIAAARLALTRTTNPSTVAFAKRMLRDHTLLAAKLKVAAASVGLTPPGRPSPAQTASIKRLGKLHGAAFLTGYRQSQISAHKGAVALFTSESHHGQAPTLKSAATAALPTLKMHLQMAERMSM